MDEKIKQQRKVTPDDVAAVIQASTFEDTRIGRKTTVVCMTMPNGFELVETSGCVSAENYDHALGIAVCKKRLVDKVWYLLGYQLQCASAADN